MPTQHGRPSKSRLQHQRNLSGGSSRVGLHQLQLASKDSAQPKHQLKRAGHSAVEVNAQRNSSPFPRASSRAQSKEKIAGLTTQKRATSAASSKRQQHTQAQAQPLQKHRAGFSIARSDETDDEESGWATSESGAVTPQNDDSVDGRADNDNANGRGVTPIERQPPVVALAPPMHTHTLMNGDADRVLGAVTGQLTPRAESQLTLARIDTARPQQAQTAVQQPQSHLQAPTPPVIRMEASTPTPLPPPPTTAPASITRAPAAAPTISERPVINPIRQARSEAPSPTHLKTAPPKRHPLIRQLSSHTESRGEMITPHPLIRGQSRHSSLKPTTLPPLAVDPATAKAQLLASPVSAGVGADSPGYMTQSFRLRTPSDASVESKDRLPSPKGSISSLHSVATLPAPNTARFGPRYGVDRARTLSVISHSSSSAALDSLNRLPALSRPATPPLTVHFPAESRRDVQEGFAQHQLLPPNYAAPHLTALARYNPLYESYDRVIQAKNRR